MKNNTKPHCWKKAQQFLMGRRIYGRNRPPQLREKFYQGEKRLKNIRGTGLCIMRKGNHNCKGRGNPLKREGQTACRPLEDKGLF